MGTKTEMPFTPGLISLNLNIMFVLDNHQIEDEIKALEIRQHMEHQCVHNVLQNMVAILKTKLPKERLYAKTHLEHVLARDHHNLNALADLEHIYRTLYRTSDAENCKKDKEKIMNGSGDFYNQCKAVCLMEQGYATLHDMGANIEHIANNKLTDSYKMLQAEHQRSQTDRRTVLQKCVFYNKQAIAYLDQSINCKRIDPYFIRKIDGLQKFQQGLVICANLPYRNVWDYYIAEAWNRHVDSLQKVPEKDIANREEEINKATYKALELYFKIANTRDKMEKKNIYVSRSLAQIGHILIKRSHRLANIGSEFAFVNDKKFAEFREKPFAPLEWAYKMQNKCPDTFILNRYGRALFNLAVQKTDRKEKKKILELAIEVLTTSVNNAVMNWFAYSTRMLVSELLSDMCVSQNPQKARMYLEQAYHDGHKCYVSKGSSIDMESLARICQKMAKFPSVKKYGKHHVRYIEYLHYALDYLQHGLTVSGTHDHQLSNVMASCLYDLGDFSSAAEWMKRTIALVENPKIYHYKIACLYQLKRYLAESKQNKQPYYLIKEIVFILHECQKKFDDIKVVSEYIVRNDFSAVSGLIMDTINVPNLLTQEGIDIIQDVLKFSSTLTNLEAYVVERIKSLEVQTQQISPLSEDEINLEEKFENPIAPIPIPTDTSLVPPGFEYNFFVSHSQKDIEWVKNVLLFELENKFTEEDLSFKGCIDARDFQPGKSIIQNITDAITKSYKIILVLTKHFIDSRWCKDEMEKAITRHISEKDCVIPILLEPLEENEFPHCLTNITYLDLIDLTNRKRHVQQFGKLKKALLASG